MAEWGDSVSSGSPLADSDNPTESTNVLTSSGGRPGSKANSRLSLRERAKTKKRRLSDSSETSVSKKYLIPKQPKESERSDQQFITIKEVNEDPSARKASRPPTGGGYEETPRGANERVKKQLVAEEEKKAQEQRGTSKCCILL